VALGSNSTIKVNIIGDASMLSKAMREAETGLGRFGKNMATAGRRLTMGLTVPIIGAGVAFFKLAEEQAKAEAKLSSVFKSMNAGAWTSEKALKDMATGLQAVTTYGDEAIITAQSILLSFGNITNQMGEGNDVFNRATKATLDLSAALDQDLKSSVVQIGKALNDPIQGVTALRRVGVSFTESQMDMIRTLVESGDILGAQTLILAELERQFGGTAEAIAQTAGGKMRQAINYLKDSGEVLGQALTPVIIDLADWVKKLADFISGLSSGTVLLAGKFALVAAALGPVLWLGGNVIQTFNNLYKAAVALNTALQATALQASLAGGGLKGLGLAVLTAKTSIIGLATAMTASIVVLQTWLRESLGSGVDLPFFGWIVNATALIGEWINRTEEATDASHDFNESQRFARIESNRVLPVVQSVTDGMNALAREYWNARTAAKAYADFQREQTDAFFAVEQAVLRQTSAQDAYNEAVKKYGENSPQATEAARALLSATSDAQYQMSTRNWLEGSQAVAWLAQTLGVPQRVIEETIGDVAALQALLGRPMNANIRVNVRLPKGWKMTLDGRAIATGGFQAFDTGGVVKGPKGSPQWVLAHGGETVLPTHKKPIDQFMPAAASLGGNGGRAVVINVHGSVIAERELEEVVRTALMRANRRG
jgi:hypothetical protein